MSKKAISSSSKVPSKKRIILFKGISIVLIPLLILLVVEGLLRVFNYGHNFDLFIEYKGNKDYLVFNPDASKKYFTDQVIATRGNNELFKKKKDDNTIRIFILGESTTIGYPFFHNGSFHRWLQYRLTHTYPDKNFEIINLALTAVNSYTVLGFAKEVVNYEPDAVLIYTGHNEYYGALGAASTQSLGSNPRVINLLLGLRDLRLAQLIINVYEGTKTAVAGTGSHADESRMQLMVAQQEIPYQSDLYEKGVAQFQSNMNDIFNLFSKKHIALFVSNLVSNEKDLKPFISFKADSVKFPGFKSNFTSGVSAFEKGDFKAANEYLIKADQSFNASALCNYYLGQLAYKQNDFSQAKKYFEKAKDLDGLRFRAPEQFNKILAQLSAKYPDVHMVDSRAAFEKNADHDIIGDGLTVDHVHPNLKGYAIMSDMFYNGLKQSGLFSSYSGNEMTFKQLLDKMPGNKVDSLAGIYRILNLKKRWPYNDPHAGDSIKIETKEQTLAYDLAFKNIKWSNIMDDLYQYHINNHDLLKARSVLENLILEYPADADLYERIAMLSGALKDVEGTLFNFKKSFNLSPSYDKARYLFVNYLKLDKPADAITYIDYAVNNSPSNLNLSPVKSYTEQIIQLQGVYAKDTTNVAIVMQIANAYFGMDNMDGALKYAKKALSLDSKNKIALSLMDKIKSRPTNNAHN